MKKTNIIYWVFTGLFAAFMIFSAIPDILLVPEALEFMARLGYPPYFTLFIGVAKLLGSLAILIPGYPRIKEWAYAGLFFDLIGALYSTAASGVATGGDIAFMLVIFILPIGSYVYYHKRLKEKAVAAETQAALQD